jgi:MFS family permease
MYAVSSSVNVSHLTILLSVSDICSLKDRGKFQGINEAVIAVSNGVGPILGGVFSQYSTWCVAISQRQDPFLPFATYFPPQYPPLRSLSQDLIRLLTPHLVRAWHAQALGLLDQPPARRARDPRLLLAPTPQEGARRHALEAAHDRLRRLRAHHRLLHPPPGESVCFFRLLGRR